MNCLKLFFVTLLIAGGLSSLIIWLDILMGTNPNGIVWKALNPFRVMEPAEYIIVFLFSLFFIFKSLASYIKKKRQSQTPSN